VREHRAIVLQAAVAAWIDNLDPVERDFLIVSDLAKRIGSAEKDGLRESFGLEARRRSDNARVVAFGQNDFAIVPPCDIKQSIKQIHVSHRVRKTQKAGRQSPKSLSSSGPDNDTVSGQGSCAIGEGIND
jgi:hypothetical protein